MRTTWKFPLTIDDEQIIELPPESTLLCVQVQFDRPCLWALVDDELRTSKRVIQMRGTGHPCHDVGDYVGTFQIAGGELVFHVFDGGMPS